MKNRFHLGDKVKIVGKWRDKAEDSDGIFEVVEIHSQLFGGYTYDLFYISRQGHYLKLEKVPENVIIKRGDYLNEDEDYN